MVNVSRIIYLLSFAILGWTSAFAQDTLVATQTGDTTLLPYSVSFILDSDYGTDRKPTRHTIDILHSRRLPTDSIVSVQVDNTPLNQDEAASVTVKYLPSNVAITQDPLFLTLTDFTTFRDSAGHRDGVAVTGYKHDSAFVARNFPGTNQFDFIFLASGVDRTNNGHWEPTPMFVARSDYDFDGTTELFLYLACGRDHWPRALFCIDIDRLTIEWSLPMSSSVNFENVVNCFDSINPGVLVCSYGPENHVRDSIFDDQFGYLTRIDRHGKVVFNYCLAPKFGGPLICTLPGDSLYVVYHCLPFPGQPTDSTAAWLSLIDRDGHRLLSRTVNDRCSQLTLADVSGDSMPEILYIDVSGRLTLFDPSLTHADTSVVTGLDQFCTQFRLPGVPKPVTQFSTAGNSILLTRDWTCVGVIPGITSPLVPAAFDSSGGVTMFVADRGNGFVAGRIITKSWKARIVSLLWQYRNWFVVLLVLLTVTLVIVNIRRRKAMEELARLTMRNQAMLNASPDLLFRMSADGRFLDFQANRREELLTAGDQFLGKSVNDILPPALAKNVLDSIAETLRTGSIQSFEYQLQVGDRLQDYEARLIASGKEEVLSIIRNISDRKVREAAIRRQAQILETVHQSIIVCDLNGVITDWNKGSEAISGYRPDEAIGQSIAMLYPPGEWEKERAMLEDSLKSRGRWEGETTMVTKGGKQKMIHLTVSPVRGPMGDDVGRVGYGVDITERKLAEQALRESESNFRAFFDTIGDMLLVASKEGRLQFANSAMLTQLGYTLDELNNMPVIELHPPDRRDEATRILTAMLKGELDSCPLPLMKKSGVQIPAETRVWFGQWNGAECVFGLCKDLTAEQEAQHRFQRSFQSNPALMALSDLNNRFVDVNEAFLRTIGYSRQEVIGKTARDLQLFIEPELYAAAGAQLLKDGRLTEVELKVRRKDGVILQGLFSGEIIWSQGEKYFLTVMIDITERIQATEALRESREFLQTVLNSIPARVFWKDMDDRYLGANTAFARDAGFNSPDEILGKDDFAMVWRDQAELYRADDRAVIESGEAKLLIEEPQTTGTGETVHLLTSKVPLRDTRGKVVGVLGAYQNITERKQAELALKRSEEMYRGMADHANMGILLYDDHRIYFANEQLADMLECTADDIKALSTLDLIRRLSGDQAADGWLNQIRNRLAGGDAPSQFESDVTTFRGATRRLEALARRIEIAGKFVIQATWLDITARHQAEIALRESEAKFRAVAESMTAGITIFDDEKLLYCNPASSRIAGYSNEELLQLKFWDLIHPQFRDVVRQRGKDRIQGADIQPRYEVKIVRKNGEERWIDYSARVIQFMGRTCVLGTTIDITDRILAEAELQQIYQERYQQVREIAGGVSHEIYNSLFPATTTLYKLRERLQSRSESAEQIERDLKLISLAEQAIGRAIHMTESVTYYSRLEASRQVEAIPVNEVVAELVDHNRARCEELGISITTHISEQLIVACSRHHLFSLLNNLVVNAIDALQETNQPVVAVTARPQHEQILIQISDNGPGIPAENLSRIFNAFFSTKPRSGTGLGLAMVKKIVEMYGGSVKVASVPDKGTVFDVLLPRSIAEEGDARAT